MLETSRPRRYEVGQVVPFLSQKPVLNIGGHRFVNIDSRRRLSRTEYPLLAKLYDQQGRLQSGFDFQRSSDLPPYIERSLNENNSSVANYATVSGIAASRAPNTVRYVVIISDSSNIMYGDSTGFSTTSISPSKVFRSVCYSPTHDKFFFGCQSGASVYEMDNTNPGAGVSVAGSLPAGFTNDGILMFATSGGTLFAGSTTNELARSTNGGTSWSDVSASTGGAPYEMAEDSSGNLVMGCTAGHARWSDDDGLTWNVVSEASAYGHNYQTIDCNPNTGVFIIGSGNALFRLPSYNGTLTQLTGIPSGINRIVRWVVGNTWISIFSGINSGNLGLVSTDDGLTWSADITRAVTGFPIYSPAPAGLALNGTELAILEDSNPISFSPYPDSSGEVFDTLAYPTGVAGYNNYVCVR